MTFNSFFLKLERTFLVELSDNVNGCFQKRIITKEQDCIMYRRLIPP